MNTFINKYLNKKNLIKIIYLVVEFIIYLVFIILDLIKEVEYVFYLKYSLIILNFIYSLIYFIYLSIKNKNKHQIISNLFLVIGLTLTPLADYCLGFMSNDEEFLVFGVVIFILVQVAYYIRNIYIIHLKAKESKNEVAILNSNIYLLISSLIRCILIICATLILSYGFNKEFDLLINKAALTYFILILMNLVDSIYIYRKYKSKNYLLLSIGLALFLACDLMVGLNFLFNNFIFYFLIWVFYIPSQCIILLSIEEKENI